MIGFFDSGVGGLSILQAVEELLPQHSTVYLADTAHFPYGTKDEGVIQDITVQAVKALLNYSPSVIVVACNTATTSALSELRRTFPSIPIIGVVPAIKPAVSVTRNHRIALMATERTLASTAYRQIKEEYGLGATIIDQPCGGWVELVEAGHIHDEQAEQAVQQVIELLKNQAVDTFVLGCTHYQFLRPLIQRYAGQGTTIIDSGQAVAQQVQRVLADQPDDAGHRQQIFLTTGTSDTLSSFMKNVLGRSVEVAFV